VQNFHNNMNNKEVVKKKVFVRTFGCQMNDRDSEAITGLFRQNGYTLTDDPKTADVILVNTCSVREHAEEREISFLGSLKKISREGRRMKDEGREKLIPHPSSLIPRVIGLIGCMAKARGQEIAKQMPHVNLICSPASEDRILEYVEKIQKDGGRIIDLEDRQRDEEFYQAPFNIDANHAQVVISTGCSNHCTYCIVPSVRGELRLRKPEDIVDEVKRNMDLGITRITLLGQNVNDYCFHPSNVNFIDLLKMAADINEIEEVDFMTSHPKNTSSELFNFMAGSHKIKKQLHLPIQSGSDKILKAMNRGYRREQYLKLAADYRHIVEGILGTDIIIGFPGESERDFLDTVDIVKTVGFNYAYIFMYSPRPGTAAAKLADDVPLAEKKRRHAELLALQKKISKGNITKY